MYINRMTIYRNFVNPGTATRQNPLFGRRRCGNLFACIPTRSLLRWSTGDQDPLLFGVIIDHRLITAYLSSLNSSTLVRFSKLHRGTWHIFLGKSSSFSFVHFSDFIIMSLRFVPSSPPPTYPSVLTIFSVHFNFHPAWPSVCSFVLSFVRPTVRLFDTSAFGCWCHLQFSLRIFSLLLQGTRTTTWTY